MNVGGRIVSLAWSGLLVAAPAARAQAPRRPDSGSNFPAVAASFPDRAMPGGFRTVANAPATNPLRVGRRTYAGEGALIGALVAGGALLFLAQGLCNSDSSCNSADMALPIIGGVAGGAILGLLIGGAIDKGP